MKVVFATDGSPSADHAIAEALRLLGPVPLEAWVVSVADRVPALVAIEAIGSGVGVAAAQDRLEHLVVLAEAQARLAARGVEAVVVPRIGDPADEIVAVAEAHRADLVVVGAQGRGALGRMLFGSVSARVVHRWAGATMVIRPPAAP